jgi:uncharacterized protein
MTARTETSRRVARLESFYERRPFLTFYSLTLAISWSFWIPVAVSHQALIPFWPSALFLIAGGFGPSLAAVLLTATEGGSTAIWRLFSRLLKWRVGIQWYLMVLLLPAAFCFSAVALHSLLGGVAPQLYSPVPWYLLPAYFLVVLLFVGPMPEEIGWRWYALPVLQAKRSALSANLILGSSWALWHLPLAWTGDLSWPGLPFPLFALAIVALAILFTWAYNGTGGSLLIVLLFHAAINFTLTLVPVQPTSTMPLRTCVIGVGLLWVAAIIVVIAEGPERLTRRPPR